MKPHYPYDLTLADMLAAQKRLDEQPVLYRGGIRVQVKYESAHEASGLVYDDELGYWKDNPPYFWLGAEADEKS